MAGSSDYWGITTSSAEGALSGGMMRRQHPQHGPLNYVLVESVDQYLNRAGELGATVIMGKQEILGIGWCGVIVDPQGNPLGLFEMMGQ